jgi:hypothetical protein
MNQSFLRPSDLLEIPEGPIIFSFDSKARISREFLSLLSDFKHIPCPTLDELKKFETKKENPFD